MTQDRKIVAVITSSPALGSIISMMLDDEEKLHVQQFSSLQVLVSHMRIVPVDLIVCDYELDRDSAPDLVASLRKTVPHRHYELIVLTDHITREIKLSCKFAGVDEVIVKPASPLFLKERILFRLGIYGTPEADTDHGPQPIRQGLPNGRIGSKFSKTQWSDNVVPLFASLDHRVPKPGDTQHPS